MRQVFSTNWLVWVAILACVCVLPAVSGQDSRPAQDGERTQRVRPGKGETPRAGQSVDKGGTTVRWFIGRDLLKQQPEDRGPLRAGEEEEVLAFAAEHWPRLHCALLRLREHNPRRFRERLGEHAARFRHLRRVQERSPRLARVIGAHAENSFNIRRTMRRLGQTNPGSDSRARAVERVRDLVAESVRLEIRTLTVLADEMEANQDMLVERLIADLSAPSADLSGLPERLRSQLDEWRAASTDSERRRLYGRLKRLAARRLDSSISDIQSAAVRQRTGGAEEVDRRVARMLERVDRAGEQRGPKRPGRRGPGRSP